jgi:hypothetical protein
VAQACSDRVHDDIADESNEAVIAADRRGPEPVLEQMPRPHVASVEGKGVPAVEPLHARPEVRLARFDQQMNVVGHQA